MNQHQEALVALHALFEQDDEAAPGWLDWSQGRLAKLPHESVEVCTLGGNGHRKCASINGKVLLELFSNGLIVLGRPTLHGLMLTEDGRRAAERFRGAEGEA